MDEKKKVTTRDIAKACFVSQSAVSMILSGRTDMHFSAETIKLVQDTAQKMGYVYRPRTKRTKTGMTSTIMIMCPSLSTQYYTTLIQAITLAAEEQGLYVLTAYTNRIEDREKYYLHMAEDNSYYGIIYTYAPKAVSFLNRLYRQIPIVMISDYNPELKLELLELDSKKSGHLLARHLLALGHQEIAYVTTPLTPTELPRLRRLQGIQEEFIRQNLPEENVHIISSRIDKESSSIDGNKHYDTGFQLIIQYFQKHRQKDEKNASSAFLPPITAFVGTNDFVAIGIIDALKKLGFTIPGDYSVCGFDNTLVSSFSGISLTTIDHAIGEKGAYAVSMLHSQRERMKNDSKKRAPLMRLEYEPQLIIRNSTGKARI